MSVPLRRLPNNRPRREPLSTDLWFDAILNADRPADHTGRFVWKNEAELVWVCDDVCPHPTHDQERR